MIIRLCPENGFWKSGIYHKNTLIEMMLSRLTVRTYVKNDGRDDKTVLTNQHLTQHLDLAQFTHLTNTHCS